MMICLQTWVPLRKEAGSSSEMVSAMLFGELADVLSEEGEWLKVRSEFDGYEGWIPESYLSRVKPDMNHWKRVLWHQGTSLVSGNERIHLSPGSNLPDSDHVALWGRSWDIIFRDQTPLETIEETARGFMHVPYLWGGRSDCGMDCSGLTQVVFKIHGKMLPRDAHQQAEQGQIVNFDYKKPGDLCFFKTSTGKITHVGIITETGIIHAYGRVREDKLNEDGIVNSESGIKTHQLAFIRRIE